MIPWLDDYYQFREDEFSTLMRQHNITDTAKIAPDHKILKDIEDYLQAIEKQWAAKEHRDWVPVVVTLSPDTASAAIGASTLTEDEQTRSSTHYDFKDNQYQVSWNPRGFSVHFELIIALWHEHEHARQGIPNGYTQDEKKLIWAERECLEATGDLYWSRYAEMTARLAEAQAYKEFVTTYKDKLTPYDADNLMEACRRMQRRLVNTSPPELKKLIKRQRAHLNTLKETTYLSRGFSGSDKEQIKEARRFLRQTAPNMYKEALRRLVDRYKELDEVIAELQKQVPEDIRQYEHEKECERLKGLAAKYLLPVLQHEPNDTDHYFIMIHQNKNAEQKIKEALTSGYYNVALAMSSNGTMRLIYDRNPIPREYSVLPALKEQWDRTHISNGAPDEYSEHDAEEKIEECDIEFSSLEEAR